MGSDRSSEKSQLTGFIVPRNDWAYWPEQSTAGYQGAYPGAAVPTYRTRLRLTPSGDPITSETLEIIAGTGGAPGAFAFRPSGGTYRGWEPPNVVAGVEVIDTTEGVTASMVGMPSGVLVLAMEVANTGTGARSIDVYTRAVDGTWSSPTTVVSDTVPASETDRYLRPRLVLDVDGVVHLLYLTYTGGAAQGTAVLRRRSSANDGSTWYLSATNVFEWPSGVLGEVLKIDAATSGRQWMLLFTLANGSTIHLASIDGIEFSTVGTVSSDGRCIDLVYTDGVFVGLIAFDTSTGANDVHAFRTGSAYTSITETAPEMTQLTQLGDSNWPRGSLMVEDSGRIWAYFECTALTGTIYAVHSDDGGSTWIPVGATAREPSHCFQYVSATLTECCAAFALGMGFLICDVPSSNGPLIAHQMGGWSTTANGPAGTTYVSGSVAESRLMDARTKYPIAWTRSDEEIDTHGAFTEALTGTPTISGGSISGVAGEQALYSLTSAPTAERYRMSSILQFDPASTAADSRIRLTLELCNGAGASYAVEVSIISGDVVEVFDVASAGSLGSVALTDTEQWQIKVDVSPGVASVWYRRLTSASDPADREWTALVAAGALTDNAGSATDATLIVDDSASAAWNVKLKMWLLNIGERPQPSGTPNLVLYDGLASGVGSGYENLGFRDFAQRPVYVNDGVSVRAQGVPRRLDHWTITPGGTYHPSNVLSTGVKASPRHVWRSTDTTSRVLAFQRTGAGDVHTDHHLIGVFFNGLNCREVLIEGHTGGAWTTLGTHAAYIAVGSGVTSASGLSLIPATTGTSGDAPYFRRDQLKGSWVYASSTFYEISGNTEGHWDAGAVNEKRCTVFLADAMAASSTVSCELVLRRSVALIYPSGANNTQWRGLRFTFSSAVAGDYIQAGNIVFDDVMVFGAGPDGSRSLVLEVNERANETEDGHVFIDDTLPNRRRAEITWTRTFPMVNATDGDPDYVKASTHASYGPAGSYLGAPLELRGLISQIGRKPIVYLPRIPMSSSNGVLVSLVKDDAAGAFLARFVPESLRTEATYGLAESADEIVRSSAVTLREVI